MDRPVAGYERWAREIPVVFHEHVLEEASYSPREDFRKDPACIAALKHFASLVPIAQAVRKPLFDLKQADGIGGGQIQAVARCRKELEDLIGEIMVRLYSLAYC